MVLLLYIFKLFEFFEKLALVYKKCDIIKSNILIKRCYNGGVKGLKIYY